MLGFIELHFRSDDPKTARPISVAVERIVDFCPIDEARDFCRVTLDDGTSEGATLDAQESYEEVVAKLEAFQQAIAAASRTQRPFIRTHRGNKP